MIPIARPDVGPEEAAAVAEVLAERHDRPGLAASPSSRSAGPSTVGVKHAIAVSNGTVALMCIYRRPRPRARRRGHHGLAHLQRDGQRDPVDGRDARSSSTSSRTRTSSTRLGSRPRSRPGRGRSRPVHLFGLVADMDMITAIADRHGLAVVEDACQAHGATFRGRRAGSFGHGAFSLYAHEEHDDRRGRLHHHQRRPPGGLPAPLPHQGMRQRYHHEILGFNFRLTDISAAIGLVQFDEARAEHARRRQEIAARYDDGFADLPIGVPVTPEGRTHVFHQYTIDVGPERGRDRRGARGAGSRDRDLLPDPGASPAVRDGARPARRSAGHRSRRGADAVAADVPGADRRRADQP